MPVLRLVDGEKRLLLSLHGMWQHQWMFIRKQLEYEMAKSVNKVILVGNVGQDPEVKYTAVEFLWLKSASRRMNDSKTGTINGKIERNGTASWPGSDWRRSWESMSARDRNSTLKANCRHRAGKTGRTARRNIEPRLSPGTLSCSVRGTMGRKPAEKFPAKNAARSLPPR